MFIVQVVMSIAIKTVVNPRTHVDEVIVYNYHICINCAVSLNSELLLAI